MAPDREAGPCARGSASPARLASLRPAPPPPPPPAPPPPRAAPARGASAAADPLAQGPDPADGPEGLVLVRAEVCLQIAKQPLALAVQLLEHVLRRSAGLHLTERRRT